MIYAFIALTIVIYFCITIAIFLGLKDEKSMSFVDKCKRIVGLKQSKQFTEI